MSWVVVGVVGGGIVGGYIQGQAARDAATTQANASRDASQVQYDMYQQQRADYEPWRQAGTRALTGLEDKNLLDNYQGDPGYQFRLAEGNKAINAAAAARGMANSGATMKALARYGQDYASSEYDKAYNRQFSRLSTLAGFGNQANTNTANAGGNYGNQVGQNVMGAANAQSASQIAQANAMSGSINTGTNALMMSQFLKK